MDEATRQAIRREANREFVIAAAKTAVMTFIAFGGFIIAPQFFPATMLTVVSIFCAPVIWSALRGPKRARKKRTAKVEKPLAMPVGATPSVR